MVEQRGLAGPPARCAACNGREKLWGYADETIRPGRYGIAVLIVCGCRREQLRQSARSLLLSGQVRLHFAKEGNRRRKTILSAVASLPVSAVYVTERGDSLDTRSACWHLLVPTLLEREVSTLVIETMKGVEARDQRDVGDALRKADGVGALSYQHRTHRDEALLWFADALAWAAGAGGDWRRRVDHVFR